MPASNPKNAAKVKTSPKVERKKRSTQPSASTRASASTRSAASASASSRAKKEEKLHKRKRRGGENDDQKDNKGDDNNDDDDDGKAPSLLQPRPGWDTIFFFFFLTHVLITVLWHSQMILPAKLYPQCLRDLTKTYSKDWQDPLNFSQKTPVWYLSIIYCEVFLQLPFHFLAIYVFWTGSHYHPWFRIPSIMYSIHVATTFMPIFAFLTSSETLTQCHSTRAANSSCALGQTLRLKLIAVYYAPFFLIPLRLLTFSVFRTYDTTEKAASRPRGSSGASASASGAPASTSGTPASTSGAPAPTSTSAQSDVGKSRCLNGAVDTAKSRKKAD